MERLEGASETRVFSVRLWPEEPEAGRAEWRGRVYDVRSGATGYFRDWDTMVAFFREALEGPAEP